MSGELCLAVSDPHDIRSGTVKETGPASAPPVLIITGPTASGKTETAILLAEALDGEIISADSMQVYSGLDIGTAKVSAADRLRIPHHLLDIRRPGEPFSVAEYQALAEQAIKAIRGRGRRPIVCGGTGQYLSALMDGLAFPSESTDPELRRSLNREADELGLPALWARLQACDPTRPAGCRQPIANASSGPGIVSAVRQTDELASGPIAIAWPGIYLCRILPEP